MGVDHGADRQRLELAREPGAAAQARRFVDRLLHGHNVAREDREPALLVSSELVTNALQHGRGRIDLRLRMTGTFLRIEVIDEGRAQAPAVRQQAADETGGWGLRIVDQLAAQWGVYEGTTHVWADVALA